MRQKQNYFPRQIDPHTREIGSDDDSAITLSIKKEHEFIELSILQYDSDGNFLCNSTEWLLPTSEAFLQVYKRSDNVWEICSPQSTEDIRLRIVMAYDEDIELCIYNYSKKESFFRALQFSQSRSGGRSDVFRPCIIELVKILKNEVKKESATEPSTMGSFYYQLNDCYDFIGYENNFQT